MSDPGQPENVHDVVGSDFFAELVEEFYAGVADDDLLRPMYPDDLAPAKARLAMFLVQYWGGPTTYSDNRGHPRLRMRHAPYRIDLDARDAWLRHMRPALQNVAARHETPPAVVDTIDDYLVRTADFLRNVAD